MFGEELPIERHFLRAIGRDVCQLDTVLRRVRDATGWPIPIHGARMAIDALSYRQQVYWESRGELLEMTTVFLTEQGVERLEQLEQETG